MLRDITLGQFYNTESVIHSLDPRVKLVGTLAFLITIFISSNFFGYIIAILFLFFVIKKSNVPFQFMTRGIKSLFLLLMISVIFNLFLTPGRTILQIGIINITFEGLILTIKMALRLILLVIGSSVLTLTTTPSSLTAAIEKSCAFLETFKIPVTDIAMMMSIALRYIPILIEETDKIMKAQKIRGANFDQKGLINKAKALIPLIVPLFVQSFRRASDLAEAMEARCYGKSDKRTHLHPLVYSKTDYIAYIIILIYTICMILSTILYNKLDFISYVEKFFNI